MKETTVAESGPISWRRLAKVQKILSALEAANGPEDMAWHRPCFDFTTLTSERRGTYAVTVKANLRVTFPFHEGAAR